MKFATPLIRCAFLKREKRFFVYATHPETGETLAAHTPNTGSLKGVLTDPTQVAAVWLSYHGEDSPRTLKYTHELTEMTNGTLIGSHTGRANALAVEALQAGLLPDHTGWSHKLEVKFDAGTRFDLHLTNPATGATCWAEVKNVTLARDSTALFPDSTTQRGTKHLQHLTALAQSGVQALQIFIIQREDVTTFSPAEEIDPTYAKALKIFAEAGGQILAIGCTFPREHGAPTAILPSKHLPVVL